MHDFSDPIYAAIVKANIHLLLNEPFFGQLVSRLDLELCDDKSGSWCKTAATDGNKLYFNRDFVKSMSPKELLFVLGHEVLHCLYDHLGRRQGRDPKLWNYANDYIVNYTLKQHKLGEMPAHGLYDERFNDDMSSEEVYAILKKNSQELEMQLKLGKSLLDQHLEAAADGDDQDDDGDPQGQGGSGDDEDGDGDQPGKGKGGSGDEDGDGDGDTQTVRVTVTGKDGPPKLTKKELDQVRNKIKAAAIQAMQSAGAGSVPEAIRRKLQDLIEPKMDWRALLDSHIRSALKDDFTFKRLSRRDLGGGFLLPAQDVLEVVEVDVALDVSGSMSDEMVRDIMSEVKGIMETFPDFKLRVWQFDTRVTGFKEFTPHNLDDIYEYERMASGGTMFEANWEFMKQNDIEPHRFVMFTDGCPCGTWGDPNYCDTLFVIHGSTKIVAPFGQTAYYEAPEKLAQAA
jgi:predicted metal-dependent peptidase